MAEASEVLQIVKKCAVYYPGREEKARFVSLLNSLQEAHSPVLYQLVADNLGSELDLVNTALNPSNCLSINNVLTYVKDIKIDLHNCSIGDESCKMLFSPDQVYQLRWLSLGLNNIGDEGAMALSAAVEKMEHLKELYLYSNNIGDEGAMALSAAMEKMEHLETLNLTDNNIGDEGAMALSAAMEKMKHLEYLHLSRNNIGDEGAMALSAAMEKMEHLEELSLRYNPMIGEKAKKTLRKLQASHPNARIWFW